MIGFKAETGWPLGNGFASPCTFYILLIVLSYDEVAMKRLICVQVTDRSGATIGEFSDVSKVEKFVISDDVYEKRTGTVAHTITQLAQSTK